MERITSYADRILETCKRVPESYFTVPVAVAAAGQPDQVPGASDSPQDSDYSMPEENRNDHARDQDTGEK
jgi:hypothetical protein